MPGPQFECCLVENIHLPSGAPEIDLTIWISNSNCWDAHKADTRNTERMRATWHTRDSVQFRQALWNSARSDFTHCLRTRHNTLWVESCLRIRELAVDTIFGWHNRTSWQSCRVYQHLIVLSLHHRLSYNQTIFTALMPHMYLRHRIQRGGHGWTQMTIL